MERTRLVRQPSQSRLVEDGESALQREESIAEACDRVDSTANHIRKIEPDAKGQYGHYRTGN